MDFSEITNINIPEGVVIRIATPDGLVLWEKRGVEPDIPTPLSNEIWYTSTDENIVEPYMIPTDNTLKSNTYENSVGKLVFKKDLTSINNYFFYNCTTLQTIVIPNSVTSIGNTAFGFNNSLQSIVIPDSVTSIGYDVFTYCESLQKIVISNKVTSIEYGAFYECSSLQSIVIPDKVTSINEYAFNFCRSLQSITCKAVTAPTIQSNVFSYVGTKVPEGTPKILYIPQGATGYETWLEQLEDFTIEYITE